nr:Chain B, MC-PEPTIDE [unidentified]
RQMSFRL